MEILVKEENGKPTSNGFCDNGRVVMRMVSGIQKMMMKCSV